MANILMEKCSGEGGIEQGHDLQQAAAKAATTADAFSKTVLELGSVGDLQLPADMGLRQGHWALSFVFELQHVDALDLQHVRLHGKAPAGRAALSKPGRH